MEFYNNKIDEVLSKFKTSSEQGITDNEHKLRQNVYGLNELTSKKKVNPIWIFLNQFRSFIIYILIFAVIVSFIAQESVDAIVILIILLFNAFFGFFQEYKAERAIDALKKLSGLKAKVIRDGKRVEVFSKDLVPGDIILLESGSKIPADGRIIEALGFEVSEASLTGESVPVSKFSKFISQKVSIAGMKNMVFSGTNVTKGRARVVVVATGMDTEIGKIAGLVNEPESELTPLQRDLESLGKWIGVVTLLICFLVFIVGVYNDGLLPLLFSGQIFEFILASKVWFLTAISLAVAAVPEGLPIVVTIALAIGTRKLLQKNVLIRKLPSVETLGETNVICSDKTGTLTSNQMMVRKVFVNGRLINFSGEGYSLDGAPDKKISEDDELLFRAGVLCNESKLEKVGDEHKAVGDPTEVAFLVSASKAGVDFESMQKSWKTVDEKSFDSIRKIMSTVNVDPKTREKFVFTKGAPEKVLEKCDRILINGETLEFTSEMKKKIISRNDSFAKDALRVLGFAYKPFSSSKDIEENLIFIGLQAMIDPPHKEVYGAIERCKTAGIRVVMMTGDNINTATAVGREIGLVGTAMTGMDFEKLSEAEKLEKIKTNAIFARVEPSHKLEIVRLFQKSGMTVAMTGDGVNDAPAVKHANLGIAMGIMGSDVTKESSDMILQDDNFVSIVDAVEEGRGIYLNIRKFVNYLFSSNIAEVMIVFFSILLGWNLPFTAIMLLWINLVTDGLPALALSVDPSPKDTMTIPPRKSSEGIITRSMGFSVFYVSSLITLAVLGLFYYGFTNYDLAYAQTIAFSALIVMELVRLQTIRAESKIGMFSNKYLILAVLGSFLLQLSVIYTPLSRFFGTVPIGLNDWGIILLVSFGVLVMNTLGSFVLRKIFRE